MFTYYLYIGDQDNVSDVMKGPGNAKLRLIKVINNFSLTDLNKPSKFSRRSHTFLRFYLVLPFSPLRLDDCYCSCLNFGS